MSFSAHHTRTIQQTPIEFLLRTARLSLPTEQNRHSVLRPGGNCRFWLRSSVVSKVKCSIYLISEIFTSFWLLQKLLRWRAARASPSYHPEQRCLACCPAAGCPNSPTSAQGHWLGVGDMRDRGLGPGGTGNWVPCQPGPIRPRLHHPPPPPLSLGRFCVLVPGMLSPYHSLLANHCCAPRRHEHCNPRERPECSWQPTGELIQKKTSSFFP